MKVAGEQFWLGKRKKDEDYETEMEIFLTKYFIWEKDSTSLSSNPKAL